ncbi:hypothetical protein GC169_11895 [bacterium]|nr:hypothetical protein [bacterium]
MPAADAGVQAAPSAGPAPAPKVELAISEASFVCIRDMTPVRGFFVASLTGNLDATLAVANSATGGVYPVGSVVQLVPGEAMVKREPGFSAVTKDWEFFELDATPAGTKIRVRGTTEAVNRFGGNCLSCHIKADPAFDLICEQTHGCDPIPITPVMSRAIQKTDPRCPPTELTAEEAEAMKALAAFMRPPAN